MQRLLTSSTMHDPENNKYDIQNVLFYGHLFSNQIGRHASAKGEPHSEITAN